MGKENERDSYDLIVRWPKQYFYLFPPNLDIVYGADESALNIYAKLVGGWRGYCFYTLLGRHLVKEINGEKGTQAFWEIDSFSANK